MAASLKASLNVGCTTHRVREHRGKIQKKKTYMSVASPRDILRASTILERQNRLSDHLARVGANDMGAQNPVGLRLGEDFDEPFRVQVGLGTGVGCEAEFADLVFHALRFEVLLGLADPSDLGVGVDDGGDGGVVDVAVT